MDRIKVLIVDDSSFVRKALLRILDSQPDMEVVGVARDGKEAVEKLIESEPDVITLDIMMPGADGIETLGLIMERRPTPVLMLSQFTKEGADLTLKALELGAMDFIDKSTTGLMDFFGLAGEIVSKIRAIAGQRPRRISGDVSRPQTCVCKGDIDVVAVGASTGGPSALQVLLSAFPRQIDFGILIVQHMPRGFTGPLAARLDSVCDIHVKEAAEGDAVTPGAALIAPSGFHMTVSGERPDISGAVKIKLIGESLGEAHTPSADILLFSVAETYGVRATAVVLTGMGSDGSRGVVKIKESGGFAIAQDESSSTIFGMPRVAIESGAIDKILPLTSIAGEILRGRKVTV